MEASKLGRFDPTKEDSGAIIGGYPYLRIDDNGKVRTHEGRHRASLLKASGATTIPVSIEGNNEDGFESQNLVANCVGAPHSSWSHSANRFFGRC